MLLKTRHGNQIVKVTDLATLQNPFAAEVEVRLQQGEEEQDPRPFGKTDLVFPSGEDLPRCWRDPHYRDAEVERREQ